MNAIETQGLTKIFDSNIVVDKLSLKVPSGSICGFLGKNGAGKTTTIKMLIGLTKPTSGSIYLMGKERKFGVNNSLNIGYLPDVPNFYSYMTANEYMDFCGRLYGIVDKARHRAIDELLKRVDLYDVKTHIGGFSRGMKQRLGIAQALITKPDIILLDEPISALDPIGRHEVMEIIRSLRGSVTVFFSSHILSDVENVCDYALILDKGKILVDNTMENIKKHYADNTAKLRFYSASDSVKFAELAKSRKELITEKLNDLDYLLRGMDILTIGKIIPSMLAEAHIGLESYSAHVPSLEDIFLEVITHG